jgi:hypothetical protein
MKYLFDSFLKNRDAIAISMVFCSGPINYALRDGLGLAPGSTAFSTLFMFGALFLFLPYRNFRKLYSQNTPITGLALIFLSITIMYIFIYHNPLTTSSLLIYDFITILIVFYTFFYLYTVKDEKLGMNFLKISMFLSVIGCIGLIIYMALDPTYLLGARAGISFGNTEEENTGNPHIFAKGAFIGIVTALVYLKHEKRKLQKLFIYFYMLIFFMVLVLSQAMSAILATAVLIPLFIWYNNTLLGLLKKGGNLLSKWYVWLIIIAGLYKGIDFFNKNAEVIQAGYQMIELRVGNLLGTFFSSDKKSNKDVVDVSASIRVENFNKVVDSFTENLEEGEYLKIIFGNGHKSVYVDIPILEAFQSYGIIGFLLFSYFFFSMFLYCIREVKHPTSIISEFAAYGFVYFFIFTFTNGLLIDYTRWTFFALVCRFVPDGYHYIKKGSSTESQTN